MPEERPTERRLWAGDREFIHRLLIVVGVVLSVGLLITVIWLTIDVWLAVFAGVLLSVFFRAAAVLIHRTTRLPHGISLAVLLVLLVAALGGGLWLLAPRMSEQFGHVRERLPEIISSLKHRLSDVGLEKYLPAKLPPSNELAAEATKAASTVASVFSLSINALVTMAVILFLGIYLAASPRQYLTGLEHLFPLSRRPRVRQLIDAVGDTLGNWLMGQAVSMLIVGTLVAVGLSLLGIPLAIPLGILAGLLNFVPIVGALLSAFPATLLAFLVSPYHPIYVILLYCAINLGIESHIIVPLIQRFAVKLPPALAVLALFLMTRLFGYLGTLLAIPLTATFIVLVRNIYVREVLGDTSVATGTTKPGGAAPGTGRSAS